MSSDTAPETPAFQQLTADNRGPVVIVASYIFLVITVIVVVTRLITRFQVTRQFVIDDGLALASTVFLTAQTIAVTVAVNAGLGRHRSILTDAAFDRYLKAFYVSRVLSIPVLSTAKSSTGHLIMGIKPPKPVLRACQATLGLINAWALAALFATIFECSPPRVWDYQGKCVDQWALYLSNVSWNIITDLALIMLPFFLMRKVQVSNQKRWAVIGLFGCRIIVPAFAIAGAVAMSNYWTSSPPDPTWHAVNATLWTQGILNMSLITACIPCIKRFLSDLSTGMMTVNIPEPLELTMKNVSSTITSPNTTDRGTPFRGSRLFSLSRNRSQNTKSRTSTSTEMEKPKGPQLVPNPTLRTTTIEKSGSMEGLTDGVIMHTVDYEVNYEQGRNNHYQQWDARSDKIESLTSPSHHTGSPVSGRTLTER